MAKKVIGFIKLHVPGGQANPAPPVGPALGQPAAAGHPRESEAGVGEEARAGAPETVAGVPETRAGDREGRS